MNEARAEQKVIRIPSSPERSISWQKQIGIEEIHLVIPAVEDKYNTTHHYVTNNPGIYVRFHLPKIDEAQKLRVTPIVRLEEYMAGLSPSFGIVPEITQKKIEEAIGTSLPEGFSAKIDGVIIPRSTKSPILDAFGLGKILDSPDVSIHIYDQNGNFVRREILHFISSKDTERIVNLNQRISTMSEPERDKFFATYGQIYELYEKEGILERLIFNPNAPGELAVKKGLSMVDLFEICLDYGNEAKWLANLEKTEYVNTMSPEQIELLKQRRQAYVQGIKIERQTLLPSEVSILKRAIDLARESGEDDEFISQLEKQLSERELGETRYQHNISRGGIFRKGRGLFHQGYIYYFDLLLTILKSGQLIPREATYSKGTYLQNVDLSLDNPDSLRRFVLYAMDPGEKLKNIRVKPIILDITGRPIPRFKHQENSVKYTPTPLNSSLRRIIVDSSDSKNRVEKILQECKYNDVSVIDLPHWQKEINYIIEAKEQLMPK